MTNSAQLQWARRHAPSAVLGPQPPRGERLTNQKRFFACDSTRMGGLKSSLVFKDLACYPENWGGKIGASIRARSAKSESAIYPPSISSSTDCQV